MARRHSVLSFWPARVPKWIPASASPAGSGAVRSQRRRVSRDRQVAEGKAKVGIGRSPRPAFDLEHGLGSGPVPADRRVLIAALGEGAVAVDHQPVRAVDHQRVGHLVEASRHAREVQRKHRTAGARAVGSFGGVQCRLNRRRIIRDAVPDSAKVPNARELPAIVLRRGRDGDSVPRGKQRNGCTGRQRFAASDELSRWPIGSLHSSLLLRTRMVLSSTPPSEPQARQGTCCGEETANSCPMHVRCLFMVSFLLFLLRTRRAFPRRRCREWPATCRACRIPCRASPGVRRLPALPPSHSPPPSSVPPDWRCG